MYIRTLCVYLYLVQVRVLESRVGGMHQVVDAIKNGTDSCVEAIQEFSRGQGELLQDIYLLKHSNYTMTVSGTLKAVFIHAYVRTYACMYIHTFVCAAMTTCVCILCNMSSYV